MICRGRDEQKFVMNCLKKQGRYQETSFMIAKENVKLANKCMSASLLLRSLLVVYCFHSNLSENDLAETLVIFDIKLVSVK
jgi:hypothetical protein